jgi:pantoate--beta-alanine ligase
MKILEHRQSGLTVGFVPTMGALHNGHGQIIQTSRQETDITVVSIFVNPKQFAPHEDFNEYPRPVDADIAFLNNHKADYLFMPTAAEMYPADFITKISFHQGVASELEAIFRPHFFDGVAVVVTKLLMAVFPDIAYFGEKDYQQFCVIKQLVKDLNIPIKIQSVPTVREPSGLALSSRNIYLNSDNKKASELLNKVLYDVATQIKQGITSEKACQEGERYLLTNGFDKIDYLVARDSQTLSPHIQNDTRILVAAWIQNVRLIDNISL